MLVRSTSLPKWLRTSSATWEASRVRPSYMVSRIVETCSVGVEVPPHQVDVAQQLAQALQRVVLALDRDEHLGAGDQRVDRQQAQRGRAVDEDVVQRLLVRLDRPLAAGSRVPPGTPARSPHRRDRSWRAHRTGPRRRAPAGRPRRAACCRPARRRWTGLRRGGRCPAPWRRCPEGRGRSPGHAPPCRASEAARLTVVVVLPTPPFWLATTMTRVCSGRGRPSPARPRASTASWAARPIGSVVHRGRCFT